MQLPGAEAPQRATKQQPAPVLLLLALVVFALSQAVAFMLQPWDSLSQPSGVAIIALLCFAMQWLAWIPAQILQTEKFYDLVGSITYVSATGASLGYCWYTHRRVSPRQVAVSCCVLVWALRLGTFLFRRILRDGKDGRFDDVKPYPLKFFNFWNGQGLWVFLCACAVITLNCTNDLKPLGLSAVIGFAVFGFGWLIEIVADRQKSSWREVPSNKGKWIDVGLWHYSRHPNYFGEFTLWCGIFVACAGGFTRGGQYASVLGPLFTLLLLTMGSGIPMQESRADKKWGDQPAYWRYKLATSALVIAPKCSASEEAVTAAVAKAVAENAPEGLRSTDPEALLQQT